MNDDTRYGTATQEDGRWTLRFERHLAHPPAKVWRAITESEHLAAWFPADIVGERAAGAVLQLRFWPDHVEAHAIREDEQTMPGRIHVWDPPHVFEWSWDTDRLRFELEPTASGTLLRFTTWLDNRYPAASSAAGYHLCFDALETLLDTGTGPGVADVDTRPLEATYHDRLGTTASPAP